MKWRMHCESDLDSLTYPQKLLSFSNAYLDSASRLCTVLTRSSRKANYARGAVVLHLMIHAIELFLKGAILELNPNANISQHDIQNLHKQYNNLYKGKKYTFNAPFTLDEKDLNELYGSKDLRK